MAADDRERAEKRLLGADWFNDFEQDLDRDAARASRSGRRDAGARTPRQTGVGPALASSPWVVDFLLNQMEGANSAVRIPPRTPRPTAEARNAAPAPERTRRDRLREDDGDPGAAVDLKHSRPEHREALPQVASIGAGSPTAESPTAFSAGARSDTVSSDPARTVASAGRLGAARSGGLGAAGRHRAVITAIVTATAAGLMVVLSSLPEAGHRDDAVGEARTSQTASESSLAWHQPASRPGLDLPIETVGPLPPDGTVRAANGLDIDAPIQTAALLAPVETDARRPALAPTEGPPDVIGVLAPLLRARIENAPQLQSPVHPAIAEVTARSAGDLAGAALAPTAVVGDGAAAPRSAHLRPSWSHPRHTPRIAGRSGRGAAGAVASRVASIRQQALTLPAILRPTPF